MTKTLTVSIEDIEKADRLSISGTRNESEFNKTVILTVGQSKIAVDSQELAEALAAVVDFVTPPKKTIISNVTEQHIGLTNLV